MTKSQQWQGFTWNNDASACTDTNNRYQDALITLTKDTLWFALLPANQNPT